MEKLKEDEEDSLEYADATEEIQDELAASQTDDVIAADVIAKPVVSKPTPFSDAFNVSSAELEHEVNDVDSACTAVSDTATSNSNVRLENGDDQSAGALKSCSESNNESTDTGCSGDHAACSTSSETRATTPQTEVRT